MYCVVAKDVANEVDKIPSPGADWYQGVDVQGCSMDVQLSSGEGALQVDAATYFCSVKKVKLSSDLDVPRDTRLRVRVLCLFFLFSRPAPQGCWGKRAGPC